MNTYFTAINNRGVGKSSSVTLSGMGQIGGVVGSSRGPVGLGDATAKMLVRKLHLVHPHVHLTTTTILKVGDT